MYLHRSKLIRQPLLGYESMLIPGLPLNDGVVGDWLFNEGGGEVFDNSGYGNNGTWSGTGSHWAPGKDGWAGKFNGSDDYVDIGDVDIVDLMTSLSISYRIKFDTFTDTGYHVSKWKQTGLGGDGWSFVASTDSSDSAEIRFAINSSADKLSIADSTNANLVVGVWYFVTMIWDGGDAFRIYVDGALKTHDMIASNSPTDIKATTERLTVGASWSGGAPSRHADCRISSVTIWNRALSAAEVKSLYNNQYQRYLGSEIPAFVAAAAGIVPQAYMIMRS